MFKNARIPYPSFERDSSAYKSGELAGPLNQEKMEKSPRHQGPEIDFGNMARDAWAKALDGTVEFYAPNSPVQ